MSTMGTSLPLIIKVVSAPLIHKHLLMPCNDDVKEGRCCGRREANSDGYYCKGCDFFFHRKCVEELPKYIRHPSHDHILKLRRGDELKITLKKYKDSYCDVCGKSNVKVFYHCASCDFDMDLLCAKYPPPDVVDISKIHHHKLTLLKEVIEFDCGAKCGNKGYSFPYKCHKCDVSFHVNCVWNPPKGKHPSKYTIMDLEGKSLPLIMESEGVSLPLIHNHLMMPWNDVRKGNCCLLSEPISEGYYCKDCDFFVHWKCVDELPQYIQHPSHSGHSLEEFPNYIQHPSHSGHTLGLQSKPNQHHCCNLCGNRIWILFYRCEVCNFNMDLLCAKYLPPDVVDIPKMHHHTLTLLKEVIEFDCATKCGKVEKGFAYKCDECDISFHVNCVWNPQEAKRQSQGKSLPLIMDLKGMSLPLIMESEEVSLPFFHKHLMMPWYDLKLGSCCGDFKTISDGYYCKSCDCFVHKECGKSSQHIKHPSHPGHTLKLRDKLSEACNLCGKEKRLQYCCETCSFSVDLFCAKYPPPEVVDFSKTHHHKLILLKERMKFVCAAKCGKDGEGFAYKCQECDVSFHVICVWNPPEEKHPSEINHIYHPLHPLKLCTGQSPYYSDGKCRLCGGGIDDRLFYHCSSCNFSLDLRCVIDPPQTSVLELKVHAHKLIFRPRLDSFTCNACGLSGDRSPYICVQCDFMIHQECLSLPRVININRHDHRVSRTSFLGVVNSICGVCQQKVDWIWGGFSCQKCPQYVVHSKCAIRNDVWNGIELEGTPEEAEDIMPYVEIDENTIKHFSHNKHYLKFHANGLLWEESKRCSGCNHPICFQPFYGCIDCDFFLHQNCAESRKKKWHVFHNDRLTLVTSGELFRCKACNRESNGFMYKCGDMKLDIRCGAISEPFRHPGHPHHSLFYIPQVELKNCNGCERSKREILTCIESGCKFFLCFHCATLPLVVKHRVNDHLLSLCYGEQASGKYWCEICETKTDPEKWFYTCKDNLASLHTRCVMGDFSGFMPRSTVNTYFSSIQVVLNNSSSRPFCWRCKSRCMYPICLKSLGTSTSYICSGDCFIYFF